MDQGDGPKPNIYGEPKQNNPLGLFLEKNRERFISGKVEVGGVASHYYLPKTEIEQHPNNQAYYEDKLKTAISKTIDVFREMPQTVIYLFLETTEDWNEYQGLTTHPLTKIKGDNLRGLASIEKDQRVIITFNRPGLKSETNLLNEDQVPEEYKDDLNQYVDEALEQLLAHETAHVATERIVDLRFLPAWYYEGLSTMITPLSRMSTRKQTMERILKNLADQDQPPTDEQLQEWRILPIYGIYFLNYLLAQHTIQKPLTVTENPDKFQYSTNRLSSLVEVLRKTSNMRGNFSQAFADVFGLSLVDAYQGFKTYLQKDLERSSLT